MLMPVPSPSEVISAAPTAAGLVVVPLVAVVPLVVPAVLVVAGVVLVEEDTVVMPLRTTPAGVS